VRRKNAAEYTEATNRVRHRCELQQSINVSNASLRGAADARAAAAARREAALGAAARSKGEAWAAGANGRRHELRSGRLAYAASLGRQIRVRGAAAPRDVTPAQQLAERRAGAYASALTEAQLQEIEALLRPQPGLPEALTRRNLDQDDAFWAGAPAPPRASTASPGRRPRPAAIADLLETSVAGGLF